jgi:hypothetical protein
MRLTIVKSLSRQAREEPIALLSLCVAVILGVLNSDWFWRLFEGRLEVVIAVAQDELGRCADREILIENSTDNSITNVRAVVAADYLTRRGDVTLQYATLSDALVGPGEGTLLPRRDEMPISYKFDPLNLLLSIPKIAPGERIHLTFAESGPGLELQRKIIRAKKAGFMDFPAFHPVSHDGGRARMTYQTRAECNARPTPR